MDNGKSLELISLCYLVEDNMYQIFLFKSFEKLAVALEGKLAVPFFQYA